MTSEEIAVSQARIQKAAENAVEVDALQMVTLGFWLAEIAYQLAKANERNEAKA